MSEPVVGNLVSLLEHFQLVEGVEDFIVVSEIEHVTDHSKVEENHFEQQPFLEVESIERLLKHLPLQARQVDLGSQGGTCSFTSDVTNPFSSLSESCSIGSSFISCGNIS